MGSGVTASSSAGSASWFPLRARSRSSALSIPARRRSPSGGCSAGVASAVVDPIDRLDWLTRAYRVGQIIRTAALFDVYDVLADEPIQAEQVAGRVGAAVDPMRRLLRTLWRWTCYANP